MTLILALSNSKDHVRTCNTAVAWLQHTASDEVLDKRYSLAKPRAHHIALAGTLIAATIDRYSFN